MLQIPKNVMQIGEISAHTKIYMEDYVHTFVERIHDNETYLVFGKKDEHGDTAVYLIYGVEKKSDWDRGAYPYFKKHERIGTLEGAAGHKIFRPVRGAGIALTGYFIFYEQNEDMQSYMIASKEAGTESANENKEKVIEEVASRRQARRQEQEPLESRAVHREKVRKKLLKTSPLRHKFKFFSPRIRERRKPAHIWTLPELCRLGTLVLLLVLAASAVTSVNRYPDMKAVMNMISSATDTLKEKLSKDNEKKLTSIVVEENLYTEETVEWITSESSQDGEQQEMELETQEEADIFEVSEDVPENNELLTETDTVPANAVPVSYIVKKGDNLAQIIRTHYGSTARLWEICELNGIKNPDQILPGQNILLP